MTLIAFLNVHYWSEHALTLKPQSLAQLRYAVESFGRHLGREATLADLDKLKVIEWMAARKDSVAAATVNKERRSILCLWRCAAELGMAAWPCRIPKVKQPVNVPHTFTIDQITRLVKASADMPEHLFWRSLILALFDSGARISAMLAVRVSDISITTRQILLRAEQSKTLTAQVVSIADDTCAALAAQTLGRDATSFVWPWPHHHRRLFIYFRRLAEKAGIDLPPRRCFHSIRRTTASLVANDPELGLMVASRLLGHTSLTTTQRYVAIKQVRVADRLPRP